MSRRGRIDVVVVGGGVVGSACALALASRGLEVALVEATEPAPWSPARRDLRVYAIAPDSAALLRQVGAWNDDVDAVAYAYRRMRIWDAGGGDALSFDADALGRSHLGWIVEHGLLVDRAWQALAGAGVRVLCPARVLDCTPGDGDVALELDDGTRLSSRLVVAADGAESGLRRLLGVEADTHPYGQRGVVCYVRGERPHDATAWQRFLPGGPLALLPVDRRGADDAQGSSGSCECSIVWTLPDSEAERVMRMDDADFAKAVTDASDRCLGELRPTSTRARFPLRRQLARSFVQGRVLFVGDAAHVVHPLAGQGVNIGLRDVAALSDSVERARSRGADFAAAHRLGRWARERRSESALAAHAFDWINKAYTSDAVLPTLLRGHLLGAAARLPPVARALWRQANGGR